MRNRGDGWRGNGERKCLKQSGNVQPVITQDLLEAAAREEAETRWSRRGRSVIGF